MRRTKKATANLELGAVAERIDVWRQTRQGRARMPEGLWQEAAGLAGVLGVYSVARALRLDYYSLKNRLPARRGQRSPDATFVEVALTQTPAPSLRTVEVTRGDGVRLTVQAATIQDLVELARAVFVERS